MLQGESRSVILATVAAVIIAPLLGKLLSRIFPPKDHDERDSDTARHTVRNTIIEYCGVVFFIAGIGVPFLLQGTGSLKPTAENFTLMFSFGLLFMVGGISGLTALFGDRKAESFLKYFERERGISRAGVRRLAKVLVIVAVLALLAVLLLSAWDDFNLHM